VTAVSSAPASAALSVQLEQAKAASLDVERVALTF